MTRVMFVCLGNICRSPMAEFIFRKMLKDTGMDALIYAESATSHKGDRERADGVKVPNGKRRNDCCGNGQ